MDYKEDFSKIISLINNLNQKIQEYNFRLTRGMCVEKFGNSMYSYLQNTLDDIDSYRYDYIRLREIELLIDEIKYKKLRGAIAEVGVYRGEISAFLNKLLPEKKIYLFDTFEGFTDKLLSENTTHEYTNSSFFQSIKKFANTSESIILKKMSTPENCIICKGVFPQTALNIKENFCFVSIDVDFFASTLAALKYFYPKLLSGGYLFIHDYNDDELRGVKEAVYKYQDDINEKLCSVPLCDHSGTLVITK